MAFYHKHNKYNRGHALKIPPLPTLGFAVAAESSCGHRPLFAKEKALDLRPTTFSLVELQGLEPWTSSMPWKRSSQLSYSPASFRTPLPRFACQQKLRPMATVVLSKSYSVASAPWIRIFGRTGESIARNGLAEKFSSRVSADGRSHCRRC